MEKPKTYQGKIKEVERHYNAIKQLFPKSNPFLLLHHIQVDELPAPWIIEAHAVKKNNFKVAYYKTRSSGFICFEV